ncbi:MAG: hypothetical protein JSW71_08850 [Gemmatimonadota bacterium]|nr:MAG: hypothetical protein JSW71_08850 [Gemmatimonadota bacterium]
MHKSTLTICFVTAASIAGSSGCEPASISEARDQLGRGGERIAEYVLPVARDTFDVESLLDSAVVTVTSDSLLGIKLDSRSLVYGVGFFAPFVSFLDSIPIVAFQEMVQNEDLDQLDFGDIEDVVRQVDFNDARLRLNVTNTGDIAAVLVDFTLGVAELDASGQLALPPVYQPLGTPILVPVSEPGSNSLRVAANSDTSFTIQGSALVNLLVDMILDERRTALVGAGIITTDSPTGQIEASDVISVETELVAVLDFTLPDTGVVFTKNTTRDGLGVDSVEVPLLLERLQRADVITDVLNNLPFGVDLDIAFAPGDLGDGDVFANPNAVIISGIEVDTSVVNPAGQLVSGQSSTALVTLVGNEVSALLRDTFTAGVRVRVLGASTSGRRGVVRVGAAALLQSEARIQLRLGASQ